MPSQDTHPLILPTIIHYMKNKWKWAEGVFFYILYAIYILYDDILIKRTYNNKNAGDKEKAYRISKLKGKLWGGVYILLLVVVGK